jgi:hypothetical protein
MDKIIISLREAINVGSGVTKVIKAETCSYFHDGHMIQFMDKEGVVGEIPMRNVTGIIRKEGKK